MTPSAAACGSVWQLQFKECVSFILVTDGLGEDKERCVLLLGTAIFIMCSHSL